MITLLLQKILRSLRQRVDLLLCHEYLDIGERLKIASCLNIYGERVTHQMLLKRLIQDKSGGEYFRIGNYAIYFEPGYPITDRNFFLIGITQVLTETFLLPRLFSRHVKIQPGDVVFDLGANIGTMTLVFSKCVGEHGRVFAVEPVTPDIIQTNLVANHIQNVTVIPKGVADKDGQAEIFLSNFCLDASIAKREYLQNYHTLRKTIEVTTLDHLVEQSGIDRLDFIKMDIEGAEEWAIRGAANVIEKFRPKWSISSYHHDVENKPQHQKLVRLLKAWGYLIKAEDTSHIFAW